MAAACPRDVRPVRTHTAVMVEKRGDTYLIDGLADAGAEGVVHRSVQDLWRAQNAAWRARVLSQLRQAGPAEELSASTG